VTVRDDEYLAEKIKRLQKKCRDFREASKPSERLQSFQKKL
jgi:hypothetical protein